MCIKFKEQLIELYDNDPKNLTQCFMAYIGFLMEHSLDDKYKQFTKWQIEDMLMSVYNPKINTVREVLETAWCYTRRGGKSQKLTVVGIFWSLLDLSLIHI